MQRAPRICHVGALLAGLLMLAPAAHAQMLKCKGDLVFDDTLARAAILFVDLDRGLFTTPDCYKYPELRGFCAGVITRVRNHTFAFGTAVNEDNLKFRIELIRTNDAIGTDSMLNRWPDALFLGSCEPARVAPRHRRT